MRICDTCGKQSKEFTLNFSITNSGREIKEIEDVYNIDLCNKCFDYLSRVNIIDIIRLGVNESKLQEILNHFEQSAQQTYTKENIIQTIKSILYET